MWRSEVLEELDKIVCLVNLCKLTQSFPSGMEITYEVESAKNVTPGSAHKELIPGTQSVSTHCG